MVWLHEGWTEPIQRDNNRGNKADVGAKKDTPSGWFLAVFCVVWLGHYVNNNEEYIIMLFFFSLFTVKFY